MEVLATDYWPFIVGIGAWVVSVEVRFATIREQYSNIQKSLDKIWDKVDKEDA